MDSVLADLKQDLLCGTLKTLEYQDESEIYYKSKSRFLSLIINSYFDRLSDALKKPNLTYLTLFNYDQNDFGLYGRFLVDYLRNSKSTFGDIERKVVLLERYLEWIPVDLLTLREKLLAIRRVELNSVSDSMTQAIPIDKSIVTCRTVDTSNVNAQIKRKKKHQRTQSQLDYLIDAIRLSTDTQTNLNGLFAVLNESLSSSELSSLAPKLYIFGSLSNGLAMWNSDLDVTLKFEAIKLELLDYDTSMLALQVVRGILKRKLGLKIEDEFMIGSRRCPIIKLDFDKCLVGQFGLGYGLKFVECDISIRSLDGVRNSKFLSFLTKYDNRFFEMTMLLRYWAKTRANLIGPGGISSYGLTLLIVFFLQRTDPVVLPSVEQFIELYKKNRKEEHDSGKDWDFCDHVDLFAKSLNTKSTAELVVDFFKYYRNFDYRSNGMRIRTGKMVDKFTMYRENRANSPDSNLYFCDTCIAIEDPFDRTNNAGTGFNAAVCQRWNSVVSAMVCDPNSKITTENAVQVLCRNRAPNAKTLSEIEPNQPSHYHDDYDVVSDYGSDYGND